MSNAARLIIVQCHDPLMWYRDLIGHVVPLVRDLPSEHSWLSREPSGLTNIVRYRDANPIPNGWKAAANSDQFQHNDLVLEHGHWLKPRIELIGTPVGTHIVIRKEAP